MLMTSGYMQKNVDMSALDGKCVQNKKTSWNLHWKNISMCKLGENNKGPPLIFLNNPFAAFMKANKLGAI